MTQLNETTTQLQELCLSIPFEETKSIMEEKNIQVRTSDTIDSLFLLYGDEFNGLILEKDSNAIVCMSNKVFKKIDTDLYSQIEQINELKNNSIDVKLEYCEDGTIIRLYNYKGEWLTATSKCLDARKSYWSSNKSFDEMFWETFSDSNFGLLLKSGKEGLDSLDPSYTYFFILLHTENRIVVRHDHNRLMYIKRIHNKTGYEDTSNTDVSQLNISSDDVMFPLSKFYNDNKRGILIKFYNSDGSHETYQYDFESYTKIKDLRGNVPFIRTRILELLENPENLDLLKHFYSEYILSFNMVEHSLNNLYANIHKLYIESHIKHNIHIYEAHPLFKTLKQLHGQYKMRILENPEYIITIDEVKSKVNKLNHNVLSNLLGWVH